MVKARFTLTHQDEALQALLTQSNQKTLAFWALACAQRVLPFFESTFPEDPRPQQALETLQDWIDTGDFSIKVIRGAALAAHASARDVDEDNPARSAARSAGQAVSTAHVKEHALAAANYALQAVFRANIENNPSQAIADERNWQFHYLLKLQGNDIL
jgi:hypothetical protein